jgi:outer membrane lipopolysaccharide assembly protein LptE/RlpB
MRLALALAAALSTGCGYHIAGHADLLPSKIKTIAVPAFGNATVRYRLSDRIPQAITRELNTRTRYRVVADPREADAILSGSVVNFTSGVITFDSRTGRASAVQVYVYLNIMLRDRDTGNVLYSQPNLEFHQRYEISLDQRAYFEESDAALDRLSADVARAVVSAILEKF